ncbi:MAG: beta-ketoacyl-ACP synthase III [Desulfovibrionaceae bacterium]
MTDIILRGLGHHVPEKLLTNADLERIVETNDEWIVTRTGIRERRIAEPHTPLTDLAEPAARKALADAGMAPEELTHVLVATFSADCIIPNAACVLAHRLGLSGLMCMDLSAACSGFLYAVETARALVALHPEAKILVVGGDMVTSRTNFTDRSTCVLFGDGAGAAIVTADAEGLRGGRVLDILLASDGALGSLLTIRGGGSGRTYALGETVGPEYFVQMQGREVYKHAVRNMTAIARRVMEKHGVAVEDIDVFVPHQANMRILEAVAGRLEIPREKVFANLDRYGNTSAASVPLALSEARGSGFIRDGQLVLVATFGGGFTWGSALVRW